MRRRFKAPIPLLYFHESCEHTLRTIPYLQHDQKNPEDLDTDVEDHAQDETRYFEMSRPQPSTTAKTQEDVLFREAMKRKAKLSTTRKQRFVK